MKKLSYIYKKTNMLFEINRITHTNWCVLININISFFGGLLELYES